jgi:hypothetical protein
MKQLIQFRVVEFETGRHIADVVGAETVEAFLRGAGMYMVKDMWTAALSVPRFARALPANYKVRS